MDSFIPTELAVAPNPLGPALNLKLTTVPIDAESSFEVWMPPLGIKLLSEEAMLLQCDRARLEEICAKLVWLLGGELTIDALASQPETIDSWAEAMALLRDAGITFDALYVTYRAQLIYPKLDEDECPVAWTIEPVRWRIYFLMMQSGITGVQVERLPVCLTVSQGNVVTKRLQRATVGASSS